VTRARAADDFATIHRRMKELQREIASPPPTEAGEPGSDDAQPSDRERRMKERCEGLPPPWAPTIFMQKPTRLEIACRFWRMRADFEKAIRSI
jgi:hypothetical protein